MKKLFLALLAGTCFASVATITALTGDASISRDGKNIPAQKDAALELKDSIKTGAKSRLQFSFQDGSVITLS